MTPAVRLWVATLNEGHSMVETAFSGVWDEAMLSLAYSMDRGAHHVLFQCDEEPDLVVTLVGFPSLEASRAVEETDSGIAARIMELLGHRALFFLDLDISELFPDAEKVAILFSDSRPADPDSLPGRGEWGLALPSALDPLRRQGADAAAGAAAGTTPDRTWIHFAPAEHADQLGRAGPIKNFTKVLESRVTLE
ncbi:hypothetical protein SAMD00023353_1501450 [Rosellinia necatrix]|uniref:Uncharacterized protein n=1 Tax=Rosellinia necatrix TaxID=77044 RepID=A0A1W2TIT7_ROSNE|nr:hypothetical protein SAMD00023353_1501450 [Rosellinia necatrix]